jgi:hypothetical protein
MASLNVSDFEIAILGEFVKPLSSHSVRSCINTMKLVDKRIHEIFELLSESPADSNFQVDGIFVVRTEKPFFGLVFTAMKTQYSFSISYLYSERTGPLGRISLEEVPSRLLGSDVIFSIIVDSNGTADCSDGSGFHTWDIGREVTRDEARRNLLYKVLGSILANLPAPPAS